MSPELQTSPPLPERRHGRGINVPRLLARLYAHAAPDVRSRLLAVLLRPVGPLALVAIAAGAFARLLPSSRWQGVQISVEQAQRVDPQQIFELALYVEQKCPELLCQLPQLVSDPRLWIGSATGTLLLLVLRQRQNQG
ncbi:MAG: hypothetical protein QM750_05855 [Rubrivivax sp.]